uniref:enoyl-CoA hydratase/isomerase family protein n=1 Tax=Desulfosarcina sp. TaxID=2027861 RepID=UPI0035635699
LPNIAIAFGPQHGPVTASQVEDLIRASRRYDELVIAAFSFDGSSQAVIQESANPRLKIHMAHIRPDVSPGMDGLLKDSPKSQLFTVFGQPEIKLGFFPPYAAIRLPQLVGPARAVEICTTGRRYKAEEAQRMGLVAHLSEADNFQDTVDGIVGEIKACSPLIIRLNKRAVNAHLKLDFKQALSGVSDMFLNTLMKTEDTLEGIKSFEEKRRPVWKNR